MKYKNKLKNLARRIANWENNKTIQEDNRNSPGSHKKPGSQNK
jgi:hypothetical protein